MRNLLVLFSILFITACSGTKTVVTETKQKVQTLTVTDEIKMDTTIFIPGEKALLKIPLKEVIKVKPTPRIFTKKVGRSTVTVKIDSSGITATSNCDSIAKKLHYYKKRVKQLQFETTEVKTTKTEKKGYNLLELILYMLATGIVSFTTAYLLKTFKIL